MSAEERHLEDLLGAYALDALDDDERRIVEGFLAVNPAAAAEVAEYREVASMLTFSAMSAPDGVWGRIADSIGGDVAPAPQGDLAKVMPLQSRAQRRGWQRVVPIVAAAAAAVMLVVVAVSVIDRGSAADPLAAAFEQALSDPSSRVAVLAATDSDRTAKAVVDANGHGFVNASQLPPLDSSQAYQLWGVIGDQVISLGVFGAVPGVQPFSVDGPVSALAITIEPAGGVVSNGNPEGAYSGALA
jgi:anti-sigma-K factor RskA